MACAKIEVLPNGDLLVSAGKWDNQWRRVAGRWEMLGSSGAWFECEPQDYVVRRQVEDLECCLRSYTFEEGPPPLDRKRRTGESTADHVRRLQLAELRKGAKNVFAPVSLHYTPGAARAAERAAHVRALAQPMPWRTDEYVIKAYKQAMEAKRAKARA